MLSINNKRGLAGACVMFREVLAREVFGRSRVEEAALGTVIRDYFTCLTNHVVRHIENEEGPRCACGFVLVLNRC